jgi:hypothetical protein
MSQKLLVLFHLRRVTTGTVVPAHDQDRDDQQEDQDGDDDPGYLQPFGNPWWPSGAGPGGGFVAVPVLMIGHVEGSSIQKVKELVEQFSLVV